MLYRCVLICPCLTNVVVIVCSLYVLSVGFIDVEIIGNERERARKREEEDILVFFLTYLFVVVALTESDCVIRIIVFLLTTCKLTIFSLSMMKPKKCETNRLINLFFILFFHLLQSLFFSVSSSPLHLFD